VYGHGCVTHIVIVRARALNGTNELEMENPVTDRLACSAVAVLNALSRRAFDVEERHGWLRGSLL